MSSLRGNFVRRAAVIFGLSALWGMSAATAAPKPIVATPLEFDEPWFHNVFHSSEGAGGEDGAIWAALDP